MKFGGVELVVVVLCDAAAVFQVESCCALSPTAATFARSCLHIGVAALVALVPVSDYRLEVNMTNDILRLKADDGRLGRIDLG